MRVLRKATLYSNCRGVYVLRLGLRQLANDDLMKLASDSKNWAMPTGDYANTRYSKLNQINEDNVKNLQVKWTFSTGVLRGHEGGPLVIGDVMYVHTPFPNIVYALDLNNDGKILWKYEPKQDPNVIPIMCCDTVNRGVAYGDGKIILNQADTTVVALDAKTGKVAWSVKNGDETDGGKGESGTAAPDGRQGQGAHRHLRRRIRRPRLDRRPTISRTAARLAGLFDGSRRRNADRPREDHPSRQAGRQGFRHATPGKASSGRPAAARPGDGIPMIPS